MSTRRFTDVLARSFVVALAVAALSPPAGHAATFTVDNTTDVVGPCPTPTTCSLRQAIASAQSAPGPDSVEFGLPAGSVISLTNGPLVIAPSPLDGITINGPGAAALTVRRNPASLPSN